MTETDVVVGNYCDFCSNEEGTWRYPCRTFHGPAGASYGDWNACDSCHGTLENGDLDQLTQESVDAFLLLGHSADRPEVERLMKCLHAGFEANRIGPPARLETVI